MVKTNEMFIKSNSFREDRLIPVEYTCDSNNVSPPLIIGNIPEGTRSLVLIFDDITSETEGGIKNHWIVFNIPIKSYMKKIELGENYYFDKAIVAKNDFDRNEYVGPCPYVGTHDYVFSAYALPYFIDRGEEIDKDEIFAIVGDDILGSAYLSGKYKRLDITDEQDINFIDQEDREEYRKRVGKSDLR